MLLTNLHVRVKVTRWAHNPEMLGSIPASAIYEKEYNTIMARKINLVFRKNLKILPVPVSLLKLQEQLIATCNSSIATNQIALKGLRSIKSSQRKLNDVLYKTQKNYTPKRGIRTFSLNVEVTNIYNKLLETRQKFNVEIKDIISLQRKLRLLVRNYSKKA